MNVYAIDGADSLALIDAGWAGARRASPKRPGRLGRAVTDVRRVLVTHVHRDHYS